MAKLNINVGEILDRPPMPEGPATFRVEDIKDIKVNSAQKEYLPVKLRFDYNEEVYIVSDNFLTLDSVRFRDFIRSMGHDDYVDDSIELIGAEGMCIVGQEVGKDDGKIYNKVVKYLPK